MTTSIETLKTYLHDADLDTVTEDALDENVLCYYLPTPYFNLKIYLAVEEDGAIVQLHAYPEGLGLKDLTAETRERLHELVGEFNFKYRYGRWSIDEDGDPRVHFTFFVEDAPLTRRQLARVHNILSDLAVHQAQTLQIVAITGEPIRFMMGNVSAVAVQTVIDHPSLIDQVIKAVHGKKFTAKLLHEVISKPYVSPEEVDSVAEHSETEPSAPDETRGDQDSPALSSKPSRRKRMH